MHINRPTLTQGVLAAFAVIGLFFMVAEHRAHTFGALPYVLLALCPLLLYLVARHGESGETGRPPSPGHKHTDPD